MRKTTFVMIIVLLALSLPACAPQKSVDSSNDSAATAGPQGESTARRFDVVFALRGPRQPRDEWMGQLKRQYVNILISNTLREGEYNTLNLDRRFSNLEDMKLTGDERVFVITLVAPVGKRIIEGSYPTPGEELENVPPEGFAYIARYDAAGVKRTNGIVNVTQASKTMIAFNFRNLTDTLGLKDISYGAPYKN
jgi:hypothetical protein